MAPKPKRSRNLHKLHKPEDHISKMPDDILVSIISRLTFHEATATSILSTRWRYLCTYFPRLDFLSFSYTRCPRDHGIMRERLSNYENSINHFVDTYKRSRIEEFKVDMADIKGANFKKWFDFALSKNAEVIDIKMRHKGGQIFQPPNAILLHGLKCLKELCLSMISVGDQDFKVLISNCLVLESLSIQCPHKLRKVSIVGHSNLKHLDLSHVWELRFLEIRDVINLVAFKCHELYYKCVVQLGNIPKLIKLDFGEDCEGLPHAEFFVKIPSCIRDQLQTLHLLASLVFTLEPPPIYVEPPFKFENMKHIEVVIDMSMPPDFSPTYCLIKACPLLEKLVIKFLWIMENVKFEKINERGLEPYTLDFHLNNLKELEITGYSGSITEFIMAYYLVEIAESLENFTVVVCDLSKSIRQKALARARYDFQQLKSTPVKLLII